MQVANDVVRGGFAETASGIWVNAARSPDGPSGLGLTGVNGQKISAPGYTERAERSLGPQRLEDLMVQSWQNGTAKR
jgi:hypothetical protein